MEGEGSRLYGKTLPSPIPNRTVQTLRSPIGICAAIMPVVAISEHVNTEFDLMIVATLDRSGQPSADLINIGVPRDKLFPLRKIPDPVPAPKRARSTPVKSRSTNGKHS